MRRIIMSAAGVVGSEENLPFGGVVVCYTVCSPRMGVLRRPQTSIQRFDALTLYVQT